MVSTKKKGRERETHILGLLFLFYFGAALLLADEVVEVVACGEEWQFSNGAKVMIDKRVRKFFWNTHLSSIKLKRVKRIEYSSTL